MTRNPQFFRRTDITEVPGLPRELVGYGEHLPRVRWQNDAKVAVQVVVNYEEGGERNILHGDATSEAFLSDVLGATLEYLRFPRHLGGYVLGRSSWGRVGLLVATAIMVQPGCPSCSVSESSIRWWASSPGSGARAST